MKPEIRIATVIVTAFLALGDPAQAGEERKAEQLGQALNDAIRDLMGSVEPALNELDKLVGVLEQIDSLANYERPEIAANGDIILRRRPGAPPLDPVPDVRPEPRPAPPGEERPAAPESETLDL